MTFKNPFENSFDNEFMVSAGQNNPNSSHAQQGRAQYVTVLHPGPIVCRTQEQAIRLAAWLLVMSENLPREYKSATLGEAVAAVRNA